MQKLVIDCSTGVRESVDLTDAEIADRRAIEQAEDDARWTAAASAARAIEDAQAAGVPDVLLRMTGWLPA